jgi:hypothetical protein
MMNGMRRYITISFFFFSLCTAADLHRTPSVRDVMFRLCDSVAASAAQVLRQGSIVVNSTALDSVDRFYTPFLQQGISLAGLTIQDQAETALTFSVRDASVHYGETFTTSFFGTQRSIRTVRLTVMATAISQQHTEQNWSKEFSTIHTDTVLVEQIASLADFAPVLTSYILPERSFFETFIEPAIVTVSAGVAVYLFFTIRS